MIIKYRQNTFSGCGSYSVANLFDDERFLEGVAELTLGESTYDLNKKLIKYGYSCWLDTVFSTQTFFTKAPIRLIDECIFELSWDKLSEEQTNNFSMPFLVSVKRTSERNHCILALLDAKTRLIHIFDSLKESSFTTTPSEFISEYHILAVDMFFIGENQDNMFMLKDKHYIQF